MIIKVWSLLIAILASIALFLIVITNRNTEINKYTTIKLLLDVPIFTAYAILGIMTWFNIYNGLKIIFIFIPYIILRISINIIEYSKKKGAII